MHPGRTGLDESLGQLEDVERTTEPGLPVGNHRGYVVVIVTPFRPLDLIGPQQSVVDPPHQRRGAVGRIQALIGVGLQRQVGVPGHLPAAQVDGLQAGLHHLHGLVAGHGAEGVDVRLGRKQLPELLRAVGGQRVVDQEGSAQPYDVLGRVVALDAFPAGIGVPVPFEILHFATEAFGDLHPFLLSRSTRRPSRSETRGTRRSAPRSRRDGERRRTGPARKGPPRMRRGSSPLPRSPGRGPARE